MDPVVAVNNDEVLNDAENENVIEDESPIELFASPD